MTVPFKCPSICATCNHSDDSPLDSAILVYCKEKRVGVRKSNPRGICDKYTPKRKNNKYRNTLTYADHIKFDSKREAARYEELKLLQKAGEVLYFLRQVPFDLGAGTKYRCDFLIFWKDGSHTVEDVKGYATKEFKLKKKLVESKYPIKIEIVK